ncbi:lycopene cyclase domain-containing protein [Pedobacter nyackensis]|uniref:Lycopene cyclase domain-containing protein n=1 Tax=Pedobacter nyackensis TaxID=475255 RepID=A0A1W2CBN1_9SPHI|nr:hypothetical protein SAMN04488101_103247 [Pedobacter nyackensis]
MINIKKLQLLHKLLLLSLNLSSFMNNDYMKTVFPAVCLTGILFSLFALLFTALGIMSANANLLSGYNVAGLPIEGILLCFIAPAASLYLYSFLNNRFPDNRFEKFSLSISNLLLGVCIALLFFGYLKWYTATTFFVLLTLLLYVEYKNKLRFMYRFYRAYVALLIPFYLVCIIIKNQSILIFNEKASLKLYVVHLPIEAYFYFMGMLLMTVYLFEFFKSKMAKVNG